MTLAASERVERKRSNVGNLVRMPAPTDLRGVLVRIYFKVHSRILLKHPEYAWERAEFLCKPKRVLVLRTLS